MFKIKNEKKKGNQRFTEFCEIKISKEEDIKVQALYFLRPKLCLKSLWQLRKLTDLIFSGDALEHVDCVIHNLEKQSVVDVEDDDDHGNDDVVNAADDDDHNDDYGGNEEGTKNFGDNDED